MLGIIGGTGLYQIDGLEVVKEHEIETPFGFPSAPPTQVKYKDSEIIFLPRHGKNHNFLPHEVNYRANIWALKKLGVTQIISVSATGSLKEELKPGDLCIPDQYFDHTRGKRDYSFFGNGIIAHISTAKPSCEVLSSDVLKAAKELGIDIHEGGAYACVEGPRLGTRAESSFLRNAGCSLVGMTNIPEAFLAREAQISYCTIAIVTDYDCWLDDPKQHVSVEMVFETYGKNIEKIKNLLKKIIENPLSQSPDYCRKSLSGTVMTPEDALNEKQKEILSCLKM